jgi:hypothetical protein
LLQNKRHSFSLNTTFLSIFLFIGIVFGVLSGCSGKSSQAQDSHVGVSEQRNIAELPNIGERVTTERALELCVYYGFDHLAVRIEENPDLFKEWIFDGCSMTPDAVLAEIIEVPSLTEICLRHDLGYAYGEPGNEKERLEVDKKFQNELLRAGASEFAAKAMFDAVRAGGKEEFCFSFSWSFARVEPCEPGFGLKIKKLFLLPIIETPKII